MTSQGNKYVVPISHYHNKLMQDIDDAEWMSDFERADRMAEEEVHLLVEEDALHEITFSGDIVLNSFLIIDTDG